jgi:hypothetical protein
VHVIEISKLDFKFRSGDFNSIWRLGFAGDTKFVPSAIEGIVPFFSPLQEKLLAVSQLPGVSENYLNKIVNICHQKSHEPHFSLIKQRNTQPS